MPKINAAINPDKVLFGDTELNNFGPPKIFPKKYAAISLINIVDNIIKTERGEKGLGSTGN